MARIRSIHPGLFTDEAFVSCSPLARLLALGIWTECDDHGVFEWKPVTMKMKLLPADAADVPALLAELERNDIVSRETFAGKTWGVVRNFCRYQRPKKPTYRVELPQALWPYVGLNTDGSHPDHSRNPNSGKHKAPSIAPSSPTASPPLPHQSGNVGPDGGGRREEIMGGDSKNQTINTSVVVAAEPEETTTTKPIDDVGKGELLPPDWLPDQDGLLKARRAGITETMIQSEVEKFHALNTSRASRSFDWNAMWSLWCIEFAKRNPPREAVVQTSKRYEPKAEEWRRAVELWKADNSHWSRGFGPEPGQIGCRCPHKILFDAGLDPLTGLVRKAVQA